MGKQEFDQLSKELEAKQEDCDMRKTESTNQLCGIKTIRLEMYQLEGLNPLIQDCEVGDWVDQECSVSCGGGTQKVTRDIISEAGPTIAAGGKEDAPGAACPPTMREQPCNDGPNEVCPIDCVHSDWSGWGACSKDCGGGLRSRVRGIIHEAVGDGIPCEETSQTESCSVTACDIPCVLGDWLPWEQCTKACNKGITIRRKGIAVEKS